MAARPDERDAEQDGRHFGRNDRGLLGKAVEGKRESSTKDKDSGESTAKSDAVKAGFKNIPVFVLDDASPHALREHAQRSDDRQHGGSDLRDHRF